MKGAFSSMTETGNSSIVDTPKINPKNPFNNFTEYEDYNNDYREIVPQIDIPGCEIPFVPSADEKKSIRHYFNLSGGGMVLHFIFSYGFFIIIQMILQKLIMKSDGIASSEVSYGYIAGLENFFSESSINIGLNMLIMMTCNTLVFLIGSKLSKVKLSSYFQTSDLTIGTLLSYLVISFFIRYAGGIAGTVFKVIFEGADMTVGTEMMNYQYPKTVILTIVYACIAAPITEELMYRGFMLKNLSRISQRFGIFMSATLFGLMHGNVSQFIFAFVFGIFLAHIDIKHNSLIPSMVIHAFSNTVSIAISYSGVLDNYFASAIIGLLMLGLGVWGAVLLVKFYKKNRLPFTMPHQKLRNGSAVSSVMLILSVAIYTSLTIYSSFPTIAAAINMFLNRLFN